MSFETVTAPGTNAELHEECLGLTGILRRMLRLSNYASFKDIESAVEEAVEAETQLEELEEQVHEHLMKSYGVSQSGYDGGPKNYAMTLLRLISNGDSLTMTERFRLFTAMYRNDLGYRGDFMDSNAWDYEWNRGPRTERSYQKYVDGAKTRLGMSENEPFDPNPFLPTVLDMMESRRASKDVRELATMMREYMKKKEEAKAYLDKLYRVAWQFNKKYESHTSYPRWNDGVTSEEDMESYLWLYRVMHDRYDARKVLGKKSFDEFNAWYRRSPLNEIVPRWKRALDAENPPRF